MAEREHGVSGRRVRHELADVGSRVALLVDRNAPPFASSRLVALEPAESPGQLRIVFGHAGYLDDVQDQTGCIAVRSAVLNRAVTSDERPERYRGLARVLYPHQFNAAAPARFQQ